MYDVQGGGNRPRWEQLPKVVRERIESMLGGRVISTRSAAGGFSPGFASMVVVDDGRRSFVKAMSNDLTPGGVDLYSREATILRSLPMEAPSARLLDSEDDGHWLVLVYEYIAGASPVPTRPDELAAMLDAYSVVAALPLPSTGLPSFETSWAWHFDLWAQADEHRPMADGAEFAWAYENMELIRENAAHWREVVAGSSLLHGDLRADNMILTAGRRIVVVDWPEACVGAPWLDLVLAMPSIAMFPGTPSPNSILIRHPLTSRIEPERLDTVIAAMAGFFGVASTLPPVPGLPTLRRFQRDQASQALTLLADRFHSAIT